MFANFENYGQFLVHLTYPNGNDHTPEHIYTLKEAFDLVESKMYDGVIESADIVDANTGEVVAICHEEEESSDDEWFDSFDECGYNPYMGCYDFDC